MTDLLILAAELLRGPESYQRKFAAALPDGSQTYVGDPRATMFSVTGLIERAARHDRVIGGSRDPNIVLGLRVTIAEVVEAKARLCLHLQTVHLDVWEDRTRPTWEQVKAALRACR